MTSRLSILRAQLSRLRWARRTVRLATAWTAGVATLLFVLTGFFLLDVIFNLAARERGLLMLIGAGVLGWSYWRFTRPLLAVHENELDLALHVEREQSIDSDLVAALQFERPESIQWGSPALANAVVDYVARAGRQINVFEGFSAAFPSRRLAVLAASAVLPLIVATVWPAHLLAFGSRLLLGSRHYPSRTQIEQLVINGSSVLTSTTAANRPNDCKAAQNGRVSFLVQCSGKMPARGEIRIVGLNSTGRNHLDLKPLSSEDRFARLQDALDRLREAAEQPTFDISPTWRDDLSTLVRFDAPSAVPLLSMAKTNADLSAFVNAVKQAKEQWPGDSGRTQVLVGQLPRLSEDISYTLVAGDAWTDSAHVRMIPLPIVELNVSSAPPKYAASRASSVDSAGRDLAVLEGSSIAFELKSINGKPLRDSWITMNSSGGVQRVKLTPQDDSRLRWSLQPVESGLTSARRDFRYEVQVLDVDGLSLESPMRGTVRIRPDQPPTGAVQVIHKVVLPTAEPIVAYRLSDDYAVARASLLVDVERGSKRAAIEHDQPAAVLSAAASSPATSSDSHRFTFLAPGDPLVADQLPLTGQYRLNLSPLGLAKHDRLKLTLEVIDYRGENESGEPSGVVSLSDPLMLEVSDEAGVLAAIAEADQNVEQRLTDIIKRQLGTAEEKLP